MKGRMNLATFFALASLLAGCGEVSDSLAILTEASADFVGSSTCMQCHTAEYKDWQQSDHKKAMEIATADTVLGDFNNVTVAFQRLSLTGHGKVRYELKTPYSDGTIHVKFEPLDFIAYLAALVPKPRLNLTRFHGVYAPNSKYRMQVPDIHQWRLYTKSILVQLQGFQDSAANPTPRPARSLTICIRS